MPVLSKFYGIVIRMFFAYPMAPHFHAIFGNSELMVSIYPPRVIQGEASPGVRRLVLAWAQQHQEELLEAWGRCQNRQAPGQIAPL
jgi:hypothetical protein